MTNNDINTLNGALQELGEVMAANLTTKGVTASASDGLTTLAGKILTIPSGGSCYHIELDSSSYTTSGSLTVSATVQKNYSACSGETVTFTGGTTTVTATTDSSGIATATVTFTTDGTLTATIGGVSATANVTIQTYLFYDECTSAEGLSNYGQVVPVSSSTTTSYLEYNSTNNAYYVHANGDWGVIPITALNGADNFKITGEFKTKNSSSTYQGGFMFRAQNATSSITFRKYNTNCNSVINDSSQSSIGTIRSASSYWHKFEITKQGRNFTITVTDLGNDVVVGTQSRTVTFDTYYVGFMTVAGTNYGSYVRNVKAEAI